MTNRAGQEVLRELTHQKLESRDKARAAFDLGFNQSVISIIFGSASAFGSEIFLKTTNISTEIPDYANYSIIALTGLAAAIATTKYSGARPIHYLEEWRKHRRDEKILKSMIKEIGAWARRPKDLTEKDESIVAQLSLDIERWNHEATNK